MNGEGSVVTFTCRGDADASVHFQGTRNPLHRSNTRYSHVGTASARGLTLGILGLPGARSSRTLRVRLAAMTHRTARSVFDRTLARGEVRRRGTHVENTTREDSA